MRLIFLGPPGIGKGTQAKLISKKNSLAHLSTGDMLRSHIKQETEVGLLAKSYMDKGKLVPDSVVLEMVRNRLGAPDTSSGFIFDGFPRTKAQARGFEELLQSLDLFIDQVIYLIGDDAILLERLSGRRTCSKCGKITNLIFSPPKVEKRCDQCGGELFQRDDDKEEVILKRLDVYRDQTKPLVEYYDKKGLLVWISGIETVKEVAGKIEEHFNDKPTKESC
ncbi:MAG: adenylate kinase [Candidatus Marinimicrobia bacterium]|nr:adenylate kinase [Candidatus Neomarinimicrobiota bacterium]|tara:strand:+ start:1689 stop:2354 length:666 start_codon:yes stop_codon:yes gene_type:complete